MRKIYTNPSEVPKCGIWLDSSDLGKYSVDEDRVAHAEANGELEFIVDITDLWDWEAPRYELHGDEGLPKDLLRLFPYRAIFDAHSGWVAFERREDAEAFVSALESGSMTGQADTKSNLKLYFVNAWTSDGESLVMNVFAVSHQDALDRVIEYWTRYHLGPGKGPICRSLIDAEDWDCFGICHREQPEVMVWEMWLDRPDPITGCIRWNSAGGDLVKILPDVLASLQRRNAIT